MLNPCFSTVSRFVRSHWANDGTARSHLWPWNYYARWVYFHAGAIFLWRVISIHLQNDKSFSRWRHVFELVTFSQYFMISEMQKPDSGLMQTELDLSDLLNRKGSYYLPVCLSRATIVSVPVAECCVLIPQTLWWTLSQRIMMTGWEWGVRDSHELRKALEVAFNTSVLCSQTKPKQTNYLHVVSRYSLFFFLSLPLSSKASPLCSTVSRSVPPGPSVLR